MAFFSYATSNETVAVFYNYSLCLFTSKPHTIVKLSLALSFIAAPKTDEKLAVAVCTFNWGFHRAEQLGVW